MMARYYVPLRKLVFQNPGGYCDSIEWLGETSKSVATFKMSNVTELANGKNFAVSFYVGSGKDYPRDILDPLLIAGMVTM